jgi:hypothetical protein
LTLGDLQTIMNMATALAARPGTVARRFRRPLAPEKAAPIERHQRDPGSYEMTKLVYGKNDQVEFLSETEKQDAIEYLINSPDIEFRHEPNQDSGAWASEKRIYFYSAAGVPEGLRRNLTAGVGDRVIGRINCAELYDEVLPLRRA